MRTLCIVGLALTAIVGCKKTATTTPTGTTATSGVTPPAAPPLAGGVVQPGVGGVPGPGGVVQGVRGAVLRTVTQNDLSQVRLFIENASAASGQMPTKEEIVAALQKEAPKIAKQIQDGDIILTGARNRESIWAYTAKPQRGADHYIVTGSGVEQVSPEVLQQRLKGG